MNLLARCRADIRRLGFIGTRNTLELERAGHTTDTIAALEQRLIEETK